MGLKVKKWIADDSGQAIVEFVLLAVVSISVVLFLKELLKNFTIKNWSLLARRIAAPCPEVDECDPGEEFDLGR